jgi:hypothetical protein
VPDAQTSPSPDETHPEREDATMKSRSRQRVGALIAIAASAGMSPTDTPTDTTVPDSDHPHHHQPVTVPDSNHHHHSVTVHGDDDTTAVTAPGGTYDDEFCNTWIVVEQAFANTTEDPTELAAWYAERGAPLVAEVREHTPETIAEPVNAYMDAAEAFGTTGNFTVLFTDEFSDAAAALYPTFDEGCGIPVVEVSLTDYAFDGIPETLASGPTTFVVHNNSEAGEAHEMVLIRVNDDVDLTAEEVVALPAEELPQNATVVNAAFTPARDTTAGVVVNLTPGRYAYVCFVAAGSVDGTEGTGPPHFTSGMIGQFTVE